MNLFNSGHPSAAVRLFIALALIVIALPIFAADKEHAEAPARIMTKGLTAQQHVEGQAVLSKRLLKDLPASAAGRAVRIPLTDAEVSNIDRTAVSSTPLRIGLVKPISPAIEVRGLSNRTFDRATFVGRNGVAQRTREGEFVWSAVVRAERAGAIRLHVTDFELPARVEMFIYSRDGQAHGPYIASGPHGTGEFWTATIFGPEAILQFRGASNADVRRVSFKITDAGLITPRFAASLSPAARPDPKPSFCGNAECIVDATCQSGFADLKNAVAKMEWIQGAYIYTCTGGLINEFNPLQDNFFLTANHCVSKDSNAKNVNFYWRFATSTCGGSCPSNSGWPYQTSGARVSVSGRKGDFTLLQLNSAPPSGSVYLGWTNAAVSNSNGAVLNRVSNPNFGPQVYSQHQVDTGAVTCRSWPRGERIYSRDVVGAIDGGSSGSPVVNTSSQIVGQLSGTCGFNPSAVCSSGPNEDNATVDGAFAFYYSLVQPFLNP